MPGVCFSIQEFQAENLIIPECKNQEFLKILISKNKMPISGYQHQHITEAIISMNRMANVKLKLFAVIVKTNHKKEILPESWTNFFCSINWFTITNVAQCKQRKSFIVQWRFITQRSNIQWLPLIFGFFILLTLSANKKESKPWI